MSEKINILKNLKGASSSLLEKARLNQRPSKEGLKVYIVSQKKDLLKKELKEELADWAYISLTEDAQASMHFDGAKGPIWILNLWVLKAKERRKSHQGRLEPGAYAQARDLVGSCWRALPFKKYDRVELRLCGLKQEEALGTFVGVELAHYKFNNIYCQKKVKAPPQVFVSSTPRKITEGLVKKSTILAESINLARHLVNLPPNNLNPHTYSKAVSEFFKNSTTMKVSIWNAARLKKENMGLILAVGEGAKDLPCLVHLRYRPKSKWKAPIGFVGKGITFDSGGLQVKPGHGMRLMKKDMGGSAALVGLAHWLEKSRCKQPCDIYLALAENGISSTAFHPSDLVEARNGTMVEIHHTDAEGRLVLADALDVAVTQKGKDKPQLIVDVATLTGAVKVGLGSGVAGLFSNDDDLAEKILSAAHKGGEYLWRMPLFQGYRRALKTPFGDMLNAADGYGGAIRAALFLETFIQDQKWAHLDIYAWQDRPEGAYAEGGGSGQAVQTLVNYLGG